MVSTLSLFEVLIDRVHLEPRDAAVVAETISATLITPDLVAKPFLDSQLSLLRSELEEQVLVFKTDLEGKMANQKSEVLRNLYFAVLGQFAVLTALVCFLASHAK